MKTYTIQLIKEITTHIEAESDAQAIQLAQGYDTNGWNGLWINTKSKIDVIEEIEQ